MDIQRLHQLFVVKRRKLHWRIDTMHSAPTGEWCNIDGRVYHRDNILNMLKPHNVDILPSGNYRVRRVIDGKRASQTFASLEDALAA